jgi:Pregnancy-associated plasma protein-A
VHNVGHWLALAHTFSGGCSSPNDGIEDTPAQASASDSGCFDANRDTCPNLPGKDPVNNYMDLAADACGKEFTRDQLLRMRAMWFIYRAPLAAPPTKAPTKSPSMAPVPAPVKTVPVAMPVAVPVMMMMAMMMN